MSDAPSAPGPDAPASGSPKPQPAKRNNTFLGGLWRKNKPEPEFPPRDWGTAAAGGTPTGQDEATVQQQAAAPASQAPPPAVIAEEPPTQPLPAKVDATNASAVPPAEGGAAPPDPAKEPTTLAQRIRDLLSSSSDAKYELPPPPPIKKNGPPPIPPPPSNVDQALAKLLESAAVMNGALEQGKKSVWEILDRMKAPKHPEEAPKQDKGKGKETAPVGDKPGDSTTGGEREEYDDDDSSLMFYAPIVPVADSKVRVAASETVHVDQDGKIISVVRDQPPHVIQPSRPASPEPKGVLARAKTLFSKKTHAEAPPAAPLPEGEPAKEEAEEAEKTGTLEGVLNRGGSMLGTIKRKMTASTEKRKVWVPSATQLSFQASWWGYRIYLPPPVVAVLDEKSVEASKQAAVIATALKWLLNKVPVAAFPPQVRPAIAIAKKLVPYAGYLGAAIAWSWSAVKGYDKGRGVILSATWPLPWALIPSTWTEDIPAREDPPQALAASDPAAAPSSVPSTAAHAPETAV